MQKKLIELSRYEKHISLLLLILIGFITYGTEMGNLGYFKDDWYFLWAGKMVSPETIIDLFSTDRPFMGYIYMLDFLVLGDRPINWHLYALFLKMIGGLAFWWTLRNLWPEIKEWMTGVVLIYIVYPGFLSQPISTTFQNHLLTYSSALISIALLVKAVKTEEWGKRYVWYGLSLVFTAFYLPIYEYMLGLEVLKMMMLWKGLDGDQKPWKEGLKQTIKMYLPHGIITLIFVYWRFIIFESIRPATGETALLGGYLNNPVGAIMRLIIETGKDVIDTVFFAWAVPWYRYMSTATYRELVSPFVWSVIAMILVYGYYKINEGGEESENQGKQFFLIGIIGVVSALLPIVFAGREVIFNKAGFDRYTLQASVSVGVLLMGILLYSSKPARMWMMIVMVGIGVNTQIMNAQFWVEKSELHETLWWELSWRAPQIEEGTIVVVYPYEHTFEQDFMIWAPLNLMYGEEKPQPYLMGEVMADRTIHYIEIEKIQVDRFLFTTLIKDYSNVLIVSLPRRGSCVRVIDSQRPEFSEFEDDRVRSVASYSNIDLVLLEGDFPKLSKNIFGEEPAHDWCYFYQKASFARQLGDWDEVAKIGDFVRNEGMKPVDRSEWMVYLEGYAALGRFDDVTDIAQAIRIKFSFYQSICEQIELEPYRSTYQEYEFIYASLCADE